MANDPNNTSPELSPLEYARQITEELLRGFRLLPEEDYKSIETSLHGYLSAMEQGTGEEAIAEKKQDVRDVFDTVYSELGPFMTPLDEDILGDILAAGSAHARDVRMQMPETTQEQSMGGL